MTPYYETNRRKMTGINSKEKEKQAEGKRLAQVNEIIS